MSWDLFWTLCELQAVVVFLVDLSGGVESLKGAVGRWLGVKGPITLKPFDCSLCSFHWAGLIYLVASGQFSLPGYMVVCLLALATGTTGRLISAVLDLFNRLLSIRW